MDKIQKIYLSGDGAPWIKNGLGWIKGSIYVLDRYHLTKYVKKATAHMNHTTSIMWDYIDAGDKKSTRELLNVIISATESGTKRKVVQEAKRYILGNWEGIMRQYDADYVGCSAEGHVSHILSSRLSSRPLGWCKTGVDQMSRLRVFADNLTHYMNRVQSFKDFSGMGQVSADINKRHYLSYGTFRKNSCFIIFSLVGL
jgi:hypothetical protein